MDTKATLMKDYGLSHREAEVTEAVSFGQTNREVANQLFVTEKTVKFHLTNIYKKMGLKSRAQLIVRLMKSPGTSTGLPTTSQEGSFGA